MRFMPGWRHWIAAVLIVPVNVAALQGGVPFWLLAVMMIWLGFILTGAQRRAERRRSSDGD